MLQHGIAKDFSSGGRAQAFTLRSEREGVAWGNFLRWNVFLVAIGYWEKRQSGKKSSPWERLQHWSQPRGPFVSSLNNLTCPQLSPRGCRVRIESLGSSGQNKVASRVFHAASHRGQGGSSQTWLFPAAPSYTTQLPVQGQPALQRERQQAGEFTENHPSASDEAWVQKMNSWLTLRPERHDPSHTMLCRIKAGIIYDFINTAERLISLGLLDWAMGCSDPWYMQQLWYPSWFRWNVSYSTIESDDHLIYSLAKFLGELPVMI